ncbi:hypothetical protein C8R44DRAFT_883371 [Mycena epipterygia]|nr:hypothetical protein C8R44DRAFT_883371 [Mycena epipterygia]
MPVRCPRTTGMISDCVASRCRSLFRQNQDSAWQYPREHQRCPVHGRIPGYLLPSRAAPCWQFSWPPEASGRYPACPALSPVVPNVIGDALASPTRFASLAPRRPASRMYDCSVHDEAAPCFLLAVLEIHGSLPRQRVNAMFGCAIFDRIYRGAATSRSGSVLITSCMAGRYCVCTTSLAEHEQQKQ